MFTAARPPHSSDDMFRNNRLRQRDGTGDMDQRKIAFTAEPTALSRG